MVFNNVWTCNKWMRYIQQLKSIEDYHKAFSYKLLPLILPDIAIYRAGIVVVHRTATSCDMLMVEQKDRTHMVRNKKYITAFHGPPKGEAERCDSSALDTALRELYEETKIDLNDLVNLNAKMLKTAIIVQRPMVKEALIYFIVMVDEKPEVTICQEELKGYVWIDLTLGGHSLWNNVSKPTKQLLTFLEDSNICTNDFSDNIIV